MTARLTKEQRESIRKRVEACAACNGIGTAINCSDCLAGELHSVCIADTGPCAYCGGDGKSGDDEDGMALLAEVEALEAERDGWKAKYEVMNEVVQIQITRPSVVAERDRYRAALERIEEGTCNHGYVGCGEECRTIARRALAGEEER